MESKWAHIGYLVVYEASNTHVVRIPFPEPEAMSLSPRYTTPLYGVCSLCEKGLLQGKWPVVLTNLNLLKAQAKEVNYAEERIRVHP